jgi:hypothetical protein
MKAEILVVRPGRETASAWKNTAVVDVRVSFDNYSIVIRNVHIKKKEDISAAMWPCFKIEEQYVALVGFGDHDREVRHAIHNAYQEWQRNLSREPSVEASQEIKAHGLSQDELYMAKEAQKLRSMQAKAYGMPEVLPF